MEQEEIIGWRRDWWHERGWLCFPSEYAGARVLVLLKSRSKASSLSEAYIEYLIEGDPEGYVLSGEDERAWTELASLVVDYGVKTWFTVADPSGPRVLRVAVHGPPPGRLAYTSEESASRVREIVRNCNGFTRAYNLLKKSLSGA